MQAASQSLPAPGRFTPEPFATPGSQLEADYVRASLARSPRERVAASALDAVTAFVPAAVALLYAVAREGAMAPRMALRRGDCAAPATDELARRLCELEPIDPFSVRRAQAAGRSVLSSA